MINQAFSVLNSNEDFLKFIQEHGLHGFVLCNIKDSDETWFSPKLLQSLGYKESNILSWNKIITQGKREKIEKILAMTIYYGGILSGEINFLNTKGILIPMTYKSLCIQDTVVFAIKKV